jgi:hypothetical protein
MQPSTHRCRASASPSPAACAPGRARPCLRVRAFAIQDGCGPVADLCAGGSLQPVVAVEAAAILTHLDQPWPDGSRWCLNRHRTRALEPLRNTYAAPPATAALAATVAVMNNLGLVFMSLLRNLTDITLKELQEHARLPLQDSADGPSGRCKSLSRHASVPAQGDPIARAWRPG